MKNKMTMDNFERLAWGVDKAQRDRHCLKNKGAQNRALKTSRQISTVSKTRRNRIGA